MPCSQVAQIQCSGALCCPEHHTACQEQGRGPHTSGVLSWFLAPGSFRKETSHSLSAPELRETQ